MSRSLLAPGAFALALAVTPAAHAATDAELADIRDQIRQLKESYEARIQALEQRLKAAESRTAAAPEPATSAAAAPAPPGAPAAAAASGIAAFNPAISAVLQGVYANMSQDPNQYAIAGFVPSGEIVPAKRGFSIAESELTHYGQRRRQVLRKSHVLSVAREHRRGRGSVRVVHGGP